MENRDGFDFGKLDHEVDELLSDVKSLLDGTAQPEAEDAEQTPQPEPAAMPQPCLRRFAQRTRIKIYNHLSCKKGRIMIEFLDNYSIRGAI